MSSACGEVPSSNAAAMSCASCLVACAETFQRGGEFMEGLDCMAFSERKALASRWCAFHVCFLMLPRMAGQRHVTGRRIMRYRPLLFACAAVASSAFPATAGTVTFNAILNGGNECIA